MNKKTLFILLVVLAVLAGVGRSILMDQPDDSVSIDAMGTMLFKRLPANEITSISMDRPDDSVMLVKEKGVWIVQNRFGYPADFSKITDLIRKLKQTKVGRNFPVSESVSKRLSLIPPTDKDAPLEDKATRIQMKDKSETVMVDILLGNTRKREEKGVPDSQFIMFADGTDIYLVDQIFSSFLTAAPAWLKKNPIKVATQDIQKIACVGPDGTLRYSFERPGKGKDLALVSPPTKGTVKQSDLNRLAGALAGLEIEDVADPSSPPESLGKGISPRLDFTRFDGIIYRVYPGITCSPGIPCYLRIQVDYERPTRPIASGSGGDATKDKESTADKSDGALIVKANEMNGRLAPWTFIVPERQHQAFFTTLGEILENKTKK
jgi:Domain of unknown function (DUF4340)